MSYLSADRKANSRGFLRQAPSVGFPMQRMQRVASKQQVDPVAALEAKVMKDPWVLYDCFNELAQANSEEDKIAARWKASHAQKRIAKALPPVGRKFSPCPYLLYDNDSLILVYHKKTGHPENLNTITDQ